MYMYVYMYTLQPKPLLSFFALLQECVDRCCNATTCQLVAGAECRAGQCCQSDCKFQPYGTVCRASESNECDIEEYCTGDNADCPRDVFLQNLSPCMDNDSYCFSGHCQTRDSQCIHHFGTGQHPLLCL